MGVRFARVKAGVRVGKAETKLFMDMFRASKVAKVILRLVRYLQNSEKASSSRMSCQKFVMYVIIFVTWSRSRPGYPKFHHIRISALPIDSELNSHLHFLHRARLPHFVPQFS